MAILHKNRYKKINLENIGQIFYVHNGKDFIKIKVHPKMINHRFGEFVKTRNIKNQLKKK
jgi:ribosomal protein S19